MNTTFPHPRQRQRRIDNYIKPLEELKKKMTVSLRDTFSVVEHGTEGAISIDGMTPLACPGTCKGTAEDAVFHVNRYRTWFWNRANWFGKGKPCQTEMAVNKLLETWKTTGELKLSHQFPNRTNHSEVLFDYLEWEIRRLKIEDMHK